MRDTTRARPRHLESLVAGERQEPGRYLRTALEFAGGPPHIEEHLVHQLFGHRLASDETEDETVDAQMMARVQNVHRRPVTCCNAFDQGIIQRVPWQRAGSAGRRKRLAAL